MSAGTLRAEIKLDEPSKIHSSSDPVTGNVELRFTPSMTSREHSVSEFFGPLQIHVTFHGRAKSKITKATTNSRSTYRGRVPLFSKTIKIFDDSAKIAAGERWPVRFQLAFPTGFQNRVVGDWEKDSRFNISDDQALPPSFVHNYSGFSNDYESFVEYRIGVSLRAPHVPVGIVTPEEEREPAVHYQARTLRPFELKYHQHKNLINVSNEYLLQEADRPSGFRQRAKAKLSSDYYPRYSFRWALTVPQHLYVDQPISFEIRIRPIEEECTAVVIPEVRLRNVSVSLISSTIVRAEKEFFSSPEAGHKDTLPPLKGTLHDPGPFSKASDWGKTFNTVQIPANTTCSFRTVNISHTHTMQVRLTFEVAKEIFSYEPTFNVSILPTLGAADQSAGPSSSNAAVGSSSQALDMRNIDEALPRYEEGLPQYHEAVESVPPPPSKDSESTAVGFSSR